MEVDLEGDLRITDLALPLLPQSTFNMAWDNAQLLEIGDLPCDSSARSTMPLTMIAPAELSVLDSVPSPRNLIRSGSISYCLIRRMTAVAAIV